MHVNQGLRWAWLAVGLGACAAAGSAAPSGEDPGLAGPQQLASAVLAQAAASSEVLLAAPPEVAPIPLASPQAGHVVGTQRLVLDVSASRRVPVQLWYPAVESARTEAESGHPVVEFEPEGSPERATLERLTRAAPAEYSQRTMHAARSPAVVEAEASFPLILISHCNDCTRYTYFSIAERLASHGFVVAAPDHVNNTLYNFDAGNSVGVDLNDFLEQRRQDLFVLTDTLLNPNAEIIPAGLRGKIDAARIGMVGHSFGAITTGYASTRDPRIRAIAALALAISLGDNVPAVGDELAKRVKLEPFSKPSLFVLAEEDAIQLFGVNDIVRQNFKDYPKETWLATLVKTGHYSVCDLCGITPAYINGCGSGLSVTRFPLPVRYLDIKLSNDLTASLVTTFMELQLLGASATSLDAVAATAPKGVMTITHRVP